MHSHWCQRCFFTPSDTLVEEARLPARADECQTTSTADSTQWEGTVESCSRLISQVPEPQRRGTLGEVGDCKHCTAHYGDQDSRTLEQNTRRPWCQLKGDSMRGLGSAHQLPVPAEGGASHQDGGDSQSSPGRLRWRFSLPKQIKLISKFRESSCYEITDQDYRINV